MKLLPVILLCVFLISEYKSVDGKLVKDLFDKIHNTAEKVKEDVHNLFKPVKDRNNRVDDGNADKITFAEDADIKKDKNTVDVTTSSKPATTTEIKTVSSTKPPVPAESKIMFPTEAPVVTTKKSTNATDKDGKENFSGGCMAGFQRTSDGRCMPTF